MITYPIAETFYSLQGEGVYTGVPMHFIRLAGCTIGRFQGKGYTWRCAAITGEHFDCDTDFTKHSSATAHDLLLGISADETVCLTGGEPLMHEISEILECARNRRIKVHVETSGQQMPTPLTSQFLDLGECWVTVSPKLGKGLVALDSLEDNFARDATFNQVLSRWCSEIKILVSRTSDREILKQAIQYIRATKVGVPVYLQPINFEHEIDYENMDAVRKLVEETPGTRLSLQLHKFLKVR